MAADIESEIETIVSVEKLHKSFGKAVAIDEISFQIKRGEVVGLLGANGAGKSTTIQILLGLIAQTSGQVSIFGRYPWKERVAVRQRCNFSSAYVALPYNLKVVENLDVFAQLYGVANRKKKIADLLQLFEVDHLADKMTGGLSSGESTRVNLCKALLNDPEFLLLDEPTASLDPDIADKVRKLLTQVQAERHMTVLYTSHNMRDVQELCQRVLFLHQGKIIAEGSSEAILSHFGQETLEEVFIAIARNQVNTSLLSGERNWFLLGPKEYWGSVIAIIISTLAAALDC